jgi:8-oxo-dGTP diphosphatase
MGRQRIAAAGGVVWRGDHARTEVAVVHRPRYDDWSLPKGKAGESEPLLAAAVREIGEEIGAAVSPGRRLGAVQYDVDGARKDVVFWAMRYRGGSFSPGDEVDQLAWLDVGAARGRLSYPSDRAVLDEFGATAPADAVIILIRHAKAGKRSEWQGRDEDRPLDEVGRTQAEALIDFLSCFDVDRVVSATLTRCVQTVEPFARAAGLPVVLDPLFDDEVFVDAPAETQTALLALGKPGHVTVVCSQGLTIPSLIDRFGDGLESDTKKGAAWVLTLVDGDIVSTDYYEDPSR